MEGDLQQDPWNVTMFCAEKKYFGPLLTQQLTTSTHSGLRFLLLKAIFKNKPFSSLANELRDAESESLISTSSETER